jgi:hypothetical protein
MKMMEGIKTNFKLKGDKVAKPDIYLGAELSEMDVGNGVECWSMSAAKYCKSAVDNVQEELAKQGRRLPSKCVSPLSSNYTPETDTSEELKADGIQRYQELIGVLRWATEIGRIDILLETSWMSAFLASPRIGHLEQVYHMFGYLKEHPKRKLAFDPTHPMIDERRFQRHDWGDFYRDAKEAIPGDMPELRGNAVLSHCFVDADLAGHKVTRRSQTGILIFVNRAPIMWYSKRQNQVELSTFGSEFIALKTAIEMIDGMRYKLRMFGVPIEGPTNVFCDNEAVYKNSSKPESVLRKKQHSIAYHRCRESVAANTCRVAKEGTNTNLADIFTKTMPASKKEDMLDKFMY